ncbi:4-carboxy-4-hydroxy-2-oxoadipate aldolase/oxaloacetate decarboxylase [Priestia endophytica]|jgi:4-hydroxy-4-methyl-2-oxoglutarate aldolase|uniref:4-carboxy-4-hydroxy-2-oxoadipate aldolase/oxaloacetate decarboxylase n=1 Tax=Priestia endophytica TaxID=135735 RepID=UPI000F54BD33|nr:4-carboxy-4-hydroxy-2-oxoadipate aldolase/oxaloacetate decarboxylase [Priestia endophytica]RPK09298.1 4-carboxy-4-hydroxy-2-oxoadipate aldolase [Priestia endophytica]
MEKYVVKNITRPDATLIEEYKKLDVSTVYEAQGKIGLMNNSLKPILDKTLVCGPAVTAVCHAGDNLMIHAAIEVCKPGDVLVITTVGEGVAGMIGELIVSALIKRGVQGVIIDSGIRDVAQIRELGFPIWTRAVLSQGTTKTRGGWVNAPTVCAGASVDPGDLIMADEDGVVVVKKADFQSTLELSKQRLQKEEGTKQKIARGEISLDFYNLRPTLEKEQVVYYEDETEFKKKCLQSNELNV